MLTIAHTHTHSHTHTLTYIYIEREREREREEKKSIHMLMYESYIWTHSYVQNTHTQIKSKL